MEATPEKIDTAAVFSAMEKAKRINHGGYFPGKLLTDSLPALLIWSAEDEILVITQLETDPTLVRRVPVAKIRMASVGQGTMTLAIRGEKSLNLLLDWEKRQAILAMYTQDAAADLVARKTDSEGIKAGIRAVQLSRMDEDLNPITPDSPEDDWSKALEASGVKISRAGKPIPMDYFFAFLLVIGACLIVWKFWIGIPYTALVIYIAYKYHN